MSDASVAVSQNEAVLVATEMLVIDNTAERLLHVERALFANRISELEADDLLEMAQGLQNPDAIKFPQEEELSGQRLTTAGLIELHQLVWEAPRTIIDDVNWPRLVEPE